jgi:hypothetical protein
MPPATPDAPVIISRARSFVVIDNPGSISPSLRAALRPYHDDPVAFEGTRPTAYLDLPLDHAHLRSWELQMCYPDTFELMRGLRSLAFFCNPAERFVDAVLAFHDVHQPALDLREAPEATRQAAVRAFAAAFEVNAALADPRLVGFSPQTWFTHLHRERLARTVLPLHAGVDAYGAALMMLELPPHPDTHAPNQPPEAPSLLGDELLARVRALYREDYEFCASADQLCPLLSP